MTSRNEVIVRAKVHNCAGGVVFFSNRNVWKSFSSAAQCHLSRLRRMYRMEVRRLKNLPVCTIQTSWNCKLLVTTSKLPSWLPLTIVKNNKKTTTILPFSASYYSVIFCFTCLTFCYSCFCSFSSLSVTCVFWWNFLLNFTVKHFFTSFSGQF